MKAGSGAATDDRYDYVVVGGGTAGCAVASRLSEMPGVRVLLLEAGPDMLPDEVPAATLDTFPSNYDEPGLRWTELVGHNLDAARSPARRLHQARVIGGGSTIMGMMALRGTPDDYEEWRALGARGWGWDDVLPFFRKLEADLDGAGPLHGGDGPVIVRRAPLAGWSRIALDARDYAAERGLRWIDDFNGEFGDGFGAIPRFASHDRRQSSALCYLTARVRARPNLTVIGGALVSSICFDGTRVTGVVARIGGVERALACRELILSGGALLTPELLLRHGIGPAEELRALGIDVRADLPVGRNLQNHAMLQFVMLLADPGATRASERAHAHGMFRISPDDAPNGQAALMIASGGAAGQHAMARRMANFSVLLMKPESRGSVRLAGPARERLIEYRLLDSAQDARRIAAGSDFLLRFLESPRVRRRVRTPRLVTRWDRVARINAPGTLNRWRTAAAGALATLAPWAGDRMLDVIGTTLRPGTPIGEDLASAILPAGHHAGTCRIGPRGAGGVVDTEGRVHGFANLRVIDASVMPTVPRGNTNLPTLMVAEKMADAVMCAERAGIAA